MLHIVVGLGFDRIPVRDEHLIAIFEPESGLEEPPDVFEHEPDVVV
jgi:hypothetical protein